MASNKDTLLKAFHQDHAVLGKGFSRLSTALRSGQLAQAREIAEEIDRAAGPHIAFEEMDFYPRLSELHGEQETTSLYASHAKGLAVIERLAELSPDQAIDSGGLAELLAKSEAMEDHIIECGELFQAMASLPADEQAALFERLKYWRGRSPTWRELAARRRT